MTSTRHHRLSHCSFRSSFGSLAMLAAMRRASSCDGSHIAQEAGQVKVAPDPGKGQLTGATGRGLGTLHSPATPGTIFFHIYIGCNTTAGVQHGEAAGRLLNGPPARFHCRRPHVQNGKSLLTTQVITPRFELVPSVRMLTSVPRQVALSVPVEFPDRRT